MKTKTSIKNFKNNKVKSLEYLTINKYYYYVSISWFHV